MSALGQKQTCAAHKLTSALGRKRTLRYGPVHHFGWFFQQGKAVALAAHIWVSRRENAEWL